MTLNHSSDDEENRESIREQLKTAKDEIEELGGLSAFKKGEWLFRLVQKSFRNYWERANSEYLKSKYATQDEDFIAKKLTKITARNAALIGAATGAVVSTDELVAFFTGGEGGVGLPANVALALTAMASEAVLLLRFQLKLVANIGKLYGVPLDPDDPEDILTILAFAVGGSAAEAAGKVGMNVGGNIAKVAIKKYISKETLEALKRVAAKIGVKILQRTIIKYTVPIVSLGIGAGWNYLSTRSVGKIARKHFLKRRTELNRN